MSTKKVALVTGSNKGIGFAIVRQLCQQFDGDVILCSRNECRGKAAVQSLEAEGFKPRLLCLTVDDHQSIVAARDWLVREYGGLDVLVNNAAIAYTDESVKPRTEIAEETFAINFFGTADVCDVLFPILRSGARVVNVSSSTGMLMRVPSPDLRSRLSSPSLSRQDLKSLTEQFFRDVEANADKGTDSWSVRPTSAIYATSKVFLSALTWIQDREFLSDERPDIVINAVHPGYVDTDMTRHRGILSTEQGAITPVMCCLIPAGRGPRGRMVWFDGNVVDWYTDVLEGTVPVPQGGNRCAS